jgi:uncharacterized membrane protein YsdA (DUF1294 family)/cold shock CspA family protein
LTPLRSGVNIALMRFGGVVKSWNDGRGFGFIEPDQGGQDVFVHVKAFPPRVGRPQIGQRLTFEIELDREGKKRARNVVITKLAQTQKRRPMNSPVQWGGASLFAIPAFVLIYLAVASVWRVPGWMATLYVAASLGCFAAYAADKAAATAGRWRISEDTLLLLGVAGGWPGAIVAQQALRHKSNKASFRAKFWFSVVLNMTAFIVLHSPLAAGLQRLSR